MKVKIAFVQLLPGKDLSENLDIGKKACVEAKEKGADIVMNRNQEIRSAFLTGTESFSIIIPKFISAILEKRMTKASWMPVMHFSLQIWT